MLAVADKSLDDLQSCPSLALRPSTSKIRRQLFVSTEHFLMAHLLFTALTDGAFG
jgi:hypothetical protein